MKCMVGPYGDPDSEGYYLINGYKIRFMMFQITLLLIWRLIMPMP